MKIAIVTHLISHQNGGITPVVIALSKKMIENGCDVCVFGVQDRFSDAEKASYACPVQTFRPWGPTSLGWSPAMADAIRRFAPDVIHVHGIWAGHGVSAAAAAGKNIPLIISPHGMLDSWALQNSKYKKGLFRLFFENRNFRRADMFHSLCASESASFRRFGIVDKMMEIPNGIDIPEPPLCRVSEKKVYRLLFLGRIHPKKGLPDLLRSFVATQTDRWILQIAGWDQNNHQAELMSWLDTLGNRRPAVEFSGPLFGTDKRKALQNADAFILPSLSEGLPMTVLEAWAWGLPVLMTDECNLPEGFAHHAAVRIPAGQDFSKILGDFFRMPSSERMQYGNNGRALVQQYYSWDQIAKAYLEMYRSLLLNRKDSRR